VLRELDQWTRRRLRARGLDAMETRELLVMPKLRRCGVGRDQAAQAAGSPRGPWPAQQQSRTCHGSIERLTQIARSCNCCGTQSQLNLSNRRYTDPYVRWLWEGEES